MILVHTKVWETPDKFQHVTLEGAVIIHNVLSLYDMMFALGGINRLSLK